MMLRERGIAPCWHLVGHLQRNKVGAAIGRFDILHSVDSERLADAISERAETPIKVLIEVNVAGEASKHGVAPGDVSALAGRVARMPNIELVGLMTVAPRADDPEDVRPVFRTLREIRDSLGLPELSMGMTDDFEVAVEEGSTLVRVGRAIFGEPRRRAGLKLGLIGCGFMGEAVLNAALARGGVAAADVFVAEVNAARAEYIAKTHNVRTSGSPDHAVSGADIVIFAIKPQEFESTAAAIKGTFTDKQTVVSIMAGVPIAKISRGLGHAAIARVMPNTPAAIGEGMSVWTATDASERGRSRADQRLCWARWAAKSTSRTEKYIDMATALNGSGPGFVYMLIEAFIDAGVHVGLPRATRGDAGAADVRWGRRGTRRRREAPRGAAQRSDIAGGYDGRGHPGAGGCGGTRDHHRCDRGCV